MRFKVSTNIKSILGKDMISDKYIAIFELVKNSCDAGAKKVYINFLADKNIVTKIIISDDGCGMTDDDLRNKWLFMAYSEKRHGEMKNKYAGSKGIGRFSCDRLGASLVLTTKKHNKNIEQLLINWNDFEKNDSKKVEEIELEHRKLEKFEQISDSGTVLEISNLREDWSRNDILKLRSALMKLVSPDKYSDTKHTTISIIAEHEKEGDQIELKKNSRGVITKGVGNLLVNGPIENDVFEKLGLKTTIISVDISENGDNITTKIEDRGDFVFKIVRKNNLYDKLHNIKIKLFYLNRAAKMNFARTMGIDSVNYGSIFVYKNGFRIYPYGITGTDFFGINERKSQGYNRYLGTRELMGRLLIDGNNDKFVEKSSRDGGFIENPATIQLEKFFIAEAIRVLEKYVVDGIDWGDPEKEKFEIGKNEQGLTSKDVADKIIAQFANMTNKGDIISAEINPELVAFARPHIDSLQKSIKGLEKIAEVSNSSDILKLIDEIKSDTEKLKNEKKIAEKKIEHISENLRNKEAELKTREKQNISLQNKLKIDPIQYEDALHILYVISEANKAELETIYKLADKKNLKLIEKITNVINNNKRIYKLTDLSLNYNYGISVKKPKDIVKFIKNYTCDFWDDKLNVNITSAQDTIVCNFDISKISLIIDNLLSNSKKAKAKNIEISISRVDESICLKFVDDGIGLDKSISDINNIFERGYSTTFGFGLGLYHTKKVVDDMGGSIKAFETKENTGFIIEALIKYECKF